MKNSKRGSADGSSLLREVRGYVEALAVAFLVITFVFNTVGVVGASMQPTLDGGPGSAKLLESLITGDRVLVSKYHNWLVRAGLLDSYEPGTVVVHRSPRSSYDYELRRNAGCFESVLVDRCRPFLIKRIAAGAGDTISLSGGQVILNGVAVDQSFVTDDGRMQVHPVDFPVVRIGADGVEELQVGWLTDASGVRVPVLPAEGKATDFTRVDDPAVQAYFGSIIDNLVIPVGARPGEPVLAGIALPEDSYFVLGDNRSVGGSLDSRAFGLVPARDVAGPASAVIWPPRRDGNWNWRTL